MSRLLNNNYNNKTNILSKSITNVFLNNKNNFRLNSQTIIACNSNNSNNYNNERLNSFNNGLNNFGRSISTNNSSINSTERKIEEIYQKKTPTEHVLLRPDSYIGTIEKIEDDMWVLSNSMFNKKTKTVEKKNAQVSETDNQSSDKSSKNKTFIQPIKATYVPGLLKIYDEILVNAADNKKRDSTMSFIKVEINPNKGTISIMNDGKGIPIVMHSTENCYVVEMVMGNLMSGSNFNDNELKVVGGRNGFGAKLTNIFSKEFVVETIDKSSGKKYYQKWSNNMSNREDPIITNIKEGEQDYTKITFTPDLEKFKTNSLWDDDILQLMEKRLYDIAGCNPEVNVYLNGVQLNYDFEKYVKLYEHHLSGSAKKEDSEELYKEESFIFGDIDERWKIGVGLSETGQFTQVSFVNSINTIKGGTHVNYIAEQIVRYIADKMKKKHNDLEVRPINIKHHLALFVNCLIDNPSFDSQSKETLTTKSQLFGSNPEIPESILAAFVKNSKIIERVAGWVLMKQKADLVHQSSTRQSKTALIKSIQKLEDANWAGGQKSNQCTLIVTEGDSAKSLALAGLSVIGRNTYGVFPLRGKLLNVCDVKPKQLLNNEEINNLTNILGLSHKKTYETEEELKELRYGKIMIMADQDHDGSHIKGLVINFIHHFWPNLLKIGFIEEFITPIIKVSKSSTQKRSFYTIKDYQKWREGLSKDQIKQYTIKYYKGLGTSTSAEAKEYFSDLGKHVIKFKWDKDTDKYISLAFSKDSSSLRQTWIKESDMSQGIDHTIKEMTFPDFINKELIHFSWAANIRSIPSLIDGLKPGQRKILFASFKRRLTSEIKVSQLSGYVAEQTSYHHGEQSLNSTIIKMAHNFVGSNNIPLLTPSGQFGTRLQGGDDSASARYIFTKLEPISRHLFNEMDDALLNYLEEEGESIQPDYYVPIIPMVLVNGSEGIGVGMATTIPLFSPIDLIEQIICRLDNVPPLKKIIPWYRGFKGTIQPNLKSYKTNGVIKFDGKGLVISELPIGKWTSDYKDVLNDLIEKDVIRGFQEANTENSVHFNILLSNQQMEEMEDLSENEMITLFKLSSNLHLNLTVFDEKNKIVKYESPEEIIDHFFNIRLEFYNKRRSHLMASLTQQIKRLSSTIKFLETIASGKLKIQGRTKQQLIDDLESQHDFGSHTPEEYQHLFSLSILDITKERIDNLQSQLNKRQVEFNQIKDSDSSSLWKADLKQLKEYLEKSQDFQKKPLKTESSSSTSSSSSSKAAKIKNKKL
ncbi:hypothetical protein DICPUDRAFT_28071 [Dictyostelium purpureum]|uniref:DNA topoisomerase 2 n=1 Tax=Dictyostelium purpureum TaxID=5786 RepID=F0ZB94_DICPU|nr:uncharacterized protein DICPUDRAFT_28071 [Dictyostelium purpureum]EGC38781.1 hypothetical protein DICPUDRAFT_28071 [Dictyostelium purpureum]|eukprot:XP_003284675.1 hypothetical protein DICPUDRAFT_28071 [Dictyostelium purpureum]